MIRNREKTKEFVKDSIRTTTKERRRVWVKIWVGRRGRKSQKRSSMIMNNLPNCFLLLLKKDYLTIQSKNNTLFRHRRH